jgi:hypothetical protein
MELELYSICEVFALFQFHFVWAWWKKGKKYPTSINLKISVPSSHRSVANGIGT